MSQQKPGFKSEKAKQLREVRQRLAWTQQQMADALGLDPSYLSQLENGRRKLDDWYLKKAGEFEKAAALPDAAATESPPPQSTAEICLEYLEQFLATCKDPAKIAWTYVELQQHFPLDKWSGAEAEISSKLPFVAAASAQKQGAGYGREHRKP